MPSPRDEINSASLCGAEWDDDESVISFDSTDFARGRGRGDKKNTPTCKINFMRCNNDVKFCLIDNQAITSVYWRLGAIFFLDKIPLRCSWRRDCSCFSSDLSKIIRVLSDRDSEDPQSLVTSSDDEHLLSASELQEVATSLGHQDASSTASEVAQEAMATTEVEEEKSISDVMEVTSDKDESVRAKQELSPVVSATDDISDIMDLLEDTGDHIKISSWNKPNSGLSNGLAPSRQDKKPIPEIIDDPFHWRTRASLGEN